MYTYRRANIHIFVICSTMKEKKRHVFISRFFSLFLFITFCFYLTLFSNNVNVDMTDIFMCTSGYASAVSRVLVFSSTIEINKVLVVVLWGGFVWLCPDRAYHLYLYLFFSWKKSVIQQTQLQNHRLFSYWMLSLLYLYM